MKRGGEERERKREGGQSSSHGVRSTERSIFFLRFSFLPLPFQPFSLHPLLVHTLGARVYVRFLSPPLLRSYLSILLSNLRSAFSAHETRNGGGGGWRRRWRWRTTPSPLLFTLFIHSSTSPSPLSSSTILCLRSDERRGTQRNYSERKVAANEVAIQPFYHRPIPRPRHDRGGGGGGGRKTGLVKADLFGEGQCRPLLYRHT